MVVGHYATALVAKERDPKTPLWLFLFAAMLLDFAMSVFVLAGIEKLEPDPSKTGSVFERSIVDMTYSHDVVPVAVWTVLAALFVYTLTSRLVPALWAAGLVVFHELSDFAAGFGHYVMGPETQSVGLALYSKAPLPALAIELALALACVSWFTSRTKLPRWKSIGLYLTAIVGVAALLPNAI